MSTKESNTPDTYLEATEGLLQGQLIHPTQPQITFGRTEHNDVVLEEHVISRQHAVLHISDMVFWIEDLGSKNGTTLNGTRLKPHTKTQLHPSDILEIGSTIFHVLSKSAPPRPHATEIPKDIPTHADPQPRLPSIAAYTPETQFEKKPFQTPKLSPRTILYGTMIVVIGLVYLSSELKKRSLTRAKQTQGPSKNKIIIPETFSPGQATPIPTSLEADVMLTQAQSAIRFEDYRKAIRLFEQVLKVRPDDDRVLSYYEVAKQNLYRKIKVHQNIAAIEVEKLNFEKAKNHWLRIAELTQGLDSEKYQEAESQIQSISNMIKQNP